MSVSPHRSLTAKFGLLLVGFLLLQAVQLSIGILGALHTGEESGFINESGRQRVRTLVLVQMARQGTESGAWSPALQQQLQRTMADYEATFARLERQTRSAHWPAQASVLLEAAARVWALDLRPLLAGIEGDLPARARERLARYDAASLAQVERLDRIVALVEAHVRGDARKLALFQAGVLLVTLLLGVLGFLMACHMVARPLRRFIDATQVIAAGAYDRRVEAGSNDEIGALSAQFNRMLDVLQGTLHRLRLYKESLNASTDMVVITDPAASIVYANPAFLRGRGYEAHEMLRRPMGEFKSGMNDAALYRKMWCTIQGGHSWRGELVNRSKDGTVRHEEQTITPILAQDGRVQNYVSIGRDVTERKAAESRLHFLAEHDPLTGLRNRRYFQQMVANTVAQVARGASPAALLFMDLDNFKYVNDTAGHSAGDRLLVELSQHLSRRLRDTDVLARFGGDEFVLLLHDVDEAKALYVAEAHRRHIEQFLFRAGTQTFTVGGSIGIALIRGEDRDADEVIARADMGCHIAKRQGRNRVHVVTAESDEREAMSVSIGWHQRIRCALERNAFELHYQPIVDLRTGETIGHEVLLRMRDESGGEILPSAFLPAAKRFGLMADIDRWVVRAAIGVLAADAGHGRLAINLSGPAFDEALLGYIRDELRAAGVDAKRLLFEVTETEAMVSLSQPVDLLRGLSELGCGTALDDFGSGPSSYAYLKHLPVDIVKIAGSFVRDMAVSPADRAIVQSIHQVAQALGKRTVAESVEDAATLAALRELGVDFAQGYYIGRPVAQRAAVALAAEQAPARPTRRAPDARLAADERAPHRPDDESSEAKTLLAGHAE